MSNVYSLQVVKDTTEHAVIKLTALFDGSGQESNVSRIAANTLYGALATNGYPVANVQGGSANTPLSYYGLSIHRLWYDCAVTGSVEVFWKADTSKTIFHLNGNLEFDGNGNWVTIPNNAAGTAGCNGDIGITTRGMTANDSYTLIVEVRKDNAHYQRGQFNDPAAFNYGPYGLKP